jgi:hypothetical protein
MEDLKEMLHDYHTELLHVVVSDGNQARHPQASHRMYKPQCASVA